jgi:hypothetical protein
MNAHTNTGDVAQTPWNSKPEQGMPGIPNSPQGNGQTSFSASSLLDMDSLPQWLRDNGKQGGAPSPIQPSGQPNWQNGPAQSPVPPSMQTPPASPQDGNRVSASSFIDMNALPNWLRSTDQPAQGGGPVQPGMGSGFYDVSNANNANSGNNIPGMTPRADSMRVPSRPRNEVNASESSELAANVFASMLGVASSTPNFPGQQSPVKPPMNNPQQSGANPPYQQPGQGNGYGMMNPAGQGYSANPDPYSQLSQSKTNIPNPNLGGSSAGNMSIPNPNLGGSSASNMNIPNPRAVPNTPGGMNDPFGQNAYTNAASGSYNGMYSGIGQGQGNPPSLSNIASPYGASSATGNGQQNAGQSMAGMQAPAGAGSTDGQKSNKKRGIFEAIRDWLSR